MTTVPASRTGQGAGAIGDIIATVRRACGLVIDPARRDVLLGLIASRCARLSIDGPLHYLRRIETDPAELQQLIEGLTIGETYFARIPPQMRALRELVLPSLLARGDRRIRIWCAGCSTGEEPYTVALLLRKLLPPETTGSWDIRIVGTDINGAALEAAREGRYGARSVSLVDEADLQRFFTRDGTSWRVGDELRGLVEFRQHNLTIDDPPAPRLDLILCRNVLIYFAKSTMLDVVDRLHSGLVPGGWLLLGHSETLWRLYDGFELVRHDDAFQYRRRPAEPAVVRRPPPLRRPLAMPQRQPDPMEEIRDAIASGAYAAAAELAAAHVTRRPLLAELHYLHGLALVETGADEQALVALRRAAYLDPDSGFAQFLLAVVLGRLGHSAEASRAYGAAAHALSGRGPDERVSELGGRRVDDLAGMCRQLAYSTAPAPRRGQVPGPRPTERTQ